MSLINVRLRIIICVVWILALTIFGFLAFLSLGNLVFAWLKVNQVFYFGHFGAKYPLADQMISVSNPLKDFQDTTFNRYDQSLSALDNKNNTAAESESHHAAAAEGDQEPPQTTEQQPLFHMSEFAAMG
jgi:hypothetical protein